MTASLLPPVRERGPEPAVSVAGEGLTYGELREAAAALAAELQGAERVAVWADATLATCVAVVAALEAGIPIVPVNPKLGAGELAHVLSDSRGQQVDTSLFEGALALSIWETAELWATGRVPEPLGSAHRLTAPYQALRTRDGHITVGGNNERLWERLCNAIGRADLLDDARFAGNDARMRNRGELAAELEAALEERDTGEWVEALLAAGVPCGPIHDYAGVVADRHTLARAMVVELEHPVEGTVRALGMPLKLSATPGEIRRPAPLLGEHTEEVLREAGLAADEIAEVVR